MENHREKKTENEMDTVIIQEFTGFGTPKPKKRIKPYRNISGCVSPRARVRGQSLASGSVGPC